MVPVCGELAATLGNVVAQRAAMIVPPAARGRGKYTQGGLRICDNAKLRRIVASDLRGVDVNVHQACRWNAECESRIPRARVRLCQSRSDGDDQIGLAAHVIRYRKSPETRLPE